MMEMLLEPEQLPAGHQARCIVGFSTWIVFGDDLKTRLEHDRQAFGDPALIDADARPMPSSGARKVGAWSFPGKKNSSADKAAMLSSINCPKPAALLSKRIDQILTSCRRSARGSGFPSDRGRISAGASSRSRLRSSSETAMASCRPQCRARPRSIRRSPRRADRPRP
jgi:hypothetical protein